MINTKELDKLEEYLEKNNYNYERLKVFSGEQIKVFDAKNTVSWDVVIHEYSWGHKDGLLEIMSGDNHMVDHNSYEDGVEGFLDADTIINRLKSRRKKCMNINLWTETIRELNEHGKTWNDVRFVCGDDFSITKPNFETIARDTNYDGSYGYQIIAKDLKIVGDHWWLERAEYDGSEWWEYKEMPIYTEYKPIHNLCGDLSTLTECNMRNCYESIKN